MSSASEGDAVLNTHYTHQGVDGLEEEIWGGPGRGDEAQELDPHQGEPRTSTASNNCVCSSGVSELAWKPWVPGPATKRFKGSR